MPRNTQFSILNVSRWINKGMTLPKIADKLEISLEELIKLVLDSYKLNKHAANLLARAVMKSEASVPTGSVQTDSTQTDSAHAGSTQTDSAHAGKVQAGSVQTDKVQAGKAHAGNVQTDKQSNAKTLRIAVLDTSVAVRDLTRIKMCDKLIVPRIVEKELRSIVLSKGADAKDASKALKAFEQYPEKFQKFDVYVDVNQADYNYRYKKRSLVFAGCVRNIRERYRYNVPVLTLSMEVNELLDGSAS